MRGLDDMAYDVLKVSLHKLDLSSSNLLFMICKECTF